MVEGTRWVTGANIDGSHVIDLVAGRDFTPDGTIEAAEVRDGDPCPNCDTGTLHTARGIEMGHIFQLGRLYADALGLQVLDENGKLVTVTMGSYGIGPSRAVAAIAEGTLDDIGLCWPRNVAPADVHLVAAGKDEAVFAAAERIAHELDRAGIEVLYDDRAGKISPGVKFKDAELIGVPTIVVVGRGLADGVVEVKDRRTGEREDVAADPWSTTWWRWSSRPSGHQSVDEREQGHPDLGGGGGAVVGAGRVERGLLERADEDVGERADGLAGEQPRIEQRLDGQLDQAEAVARPISRQRSHPSAAGASISTIRCTSGSAQRPASRRCRRAARATGSSAPAEQAGGEPLGDLRLDLLEDRGEQVLLAGELVVERAAGHPGGPGDLVGADRGVALLGEQRTRGGDERRSGRSPSVGLGALAFHTPCP